MISWSSVKARHVIGPECILQNNIHAANIETKRSAKPQTTINRINLFHQHQYKGGKIYFSFLVRCPIQFTHHKYIVKNTFLKNNNILKKQTRVWCTSGRNSSNTIRSPSPLETKFSSLTIKMFNCSNQTTEILPTEKE